MGTTAERGFKKGIMNIYKASPNEELIREAQTKIKEGKFNNYYHYFTMKGLEQNLEFGVEAEISESGKFRGYVPYIYFGLKNKLGREHGRLVLSSFYKSESKVFEYLARQFFYQLRNSIDAGIAQNFN